MASKKYTIRLDVVTREAESGANRMTQHFKDMEARALKGLKAVEAGAKGQFVAIESLQVKGLQVTSKLEAAEKRRQDEARKEAEKTAAKVKRLMTDEEIAAKVSDARIGASNKARVMQAMQNANLQHANVARLLTDEEIKFKVKNQAIINANNKRIESAMKLADVEYKGAKNGWEGMDRFLGTVKNVAGQFIALASAQQVIGYISQSFADAASNARDAGKLTTEYRESLLELAALKDRLGNTGPELRENLMFRAQTLQSKEAARSFQEAALGVGQSAIDTKDRKGLIAQAEFAKLMTLGGSFQATEGGDAATHGALVGQMPSIMGKRVTADEAFAKEDQLYKIFQPGGATFSNLTSGFLKNSPLASSGLISPERLAAVESAFSVKNKEGHAEQTQQFVRATSGGIGRMKGVKVEGDSEKIGEYLKRIGATDKMDPIEIGKKISADLTQQEAKGVNPLTYLQSRGYGNMEDRQAILAFHGMQREGSFGGFEKLAADKADPSAAQQSIRQFQATDPVALARKGKISEDLATTTVGAGPNEYYNALTKTTFERLRGEGKLAGKYDEVMAAGLTDPVNYVRQMTVEAEAQKALNAEFGRVKPNIGKGAYDKGKNIGYRRQNTGSTYEERAQQAYGYAQEISGAGGNILPGFDKLTNIADQQLKAMQAIQEQMRANAAKAPPAQPLPMGAKVGAQMVR